MAATAQQPELIAIVGPTACGKSALALKLAKIFNGEVITADSRTIYKGMDIGTAKPTRKEQEEIPHWGIDLVKPGEDFNAHKFKQYAFKAIKDIHQRNKLPILVGGTGLYIDSVLFDFEFVGSDKTQRPKLEMLSIEELQQGIKNKGYKMPENYMNRRHLIRTIEREGYIGIKKPLSPNVLLVGLMPEPRELKKRIKERSESYFKKGLLKETKELISKYPEDAVIKNPGIAYKACIKLINGDISEDQAINFIQKEEWQYARRQRTWFRRNKFIHWYDSPESAYLDISATLNN